MRVREEREKRQGDRDRQRESQPKKKKKKQEKKQKQKTKPFFFVPKRKDSTAVDQPNQTNEQTMMDEARYVMR